MTFINCVPASIAVQTIGITAFGNDRKEESFPEANAMMRRIVMEETAKAGLKCDFVQQTLPKQSLGAALLNGTGPYAAVRKMALASTAPLTIVAAADSGNEPGRPEYLNVGGFGIVQNKLPLAGVRYVSVYAATYMLRRDRAADKTEFVSDSAPRFFRGFVDQKEWATANPSSRAHAIAIFERKFRSAVAGILGNSEQQPPPVKGEKL